MTAALVVLHVLVCFFLIAVVLLQKGKGAEIGAVFGGGASGTVFGSRGAGNFLTKLTTASAVIFMVTSLGLSYIWTSGGSRLFEDGAQPAAPAPADESLFEELGAFEAEGGQAQPSEPSSEAAGEAAEGAPPEAP